MENDRPYPKRIIVDFDGTICGFAFPDTGPPEPHVQEGLQKLKNAGFEIVIHSIRINKNWGFASQCKHLSIIETYMSVHNLPYDEILVNPGKPFAMAYIDDRAVQHKGDWLETAQETLKMIREKDVQENKTVTK
ncbi:MAG TPA: hypothetical protein VMW50_08285 [Dehalococcoidia bacterium]|nr:hypothetical protein [Dehalococcoidia bacterium]